jgi:hypothetical protein
MKSSWFCVPDMAGKECTIHDGTRYIARNVPDEFAALVSHAPAMLAEIRHIVTHAECADGVAIITTHDIEALERIIADVEGR